MTNKIMISSLSAVFIMMVAGISMAGSASQGTSQIQLPYAKCEYILLSRDETKSSWFHTKRIFSDELFWNDVTATGRHTFTATLSDEGPLLRFNISGTLKPCIGTPPNSYLDVGEAQFIPRTIEIFDEATSKRIQTINTAKRIEHGWDYMEGYGAGVVQLIDMNFDGYLDLRLLVDSGFKVPHVYDTYLYDPSRKRFQYHKALSKMQIFKINRRSKELVSNARSGGLCGEEYLEYFTMVGNRLFITKAKWTQEDKLKDYVAEDYNCNLLTGIPMRYIPWEEPMDFSGVVFRKHDYDGHFFYEQGKAHSLVGRYPIKIVSIEPTRNTRLIAHEHREIIGMCCRDDMMLMNYIWGCYEKRPRYLIVP